TTLPSVLVLPSLGVMRPRPISRAGSWTLVILVSLCANAATKAHVIAFGKWMPVQCVAGYGANEKPLSIKVRALIVYAPVKEYIVGSPDEVAEALFVARRVLRVNDSLPVDAAPKWQWERGGWLLVDRLTGHISAISLPEFDAALSVTSWYRD